MFELHDVCIEKVFFAISNKIKNVEFTEEKRNSRESFECLIEFLLCHYIAGLSHLMNDDLHPFIYLSQTVFIYNR
jgi:hypothetical protein